MAVLTDKEILIAGAHEFLTPYLYKAVEGAASTDARVWMLGTGPLAGIGFDLTGGVPEFPATMSTGIYCDSLDDRQRGYTPDSAVRAVENLTAALNPAVLTSMVYISSVEVYGVASGEGVDESVTPSPITRYGKAKLAVEEYLTRWCDEHDVALAILRPAMIVGTGMGGELRTLVNRIYRGSYRHIVGNEARVSVVHATSLADAAVAVTGRRGVWNVTDGVDPSRHDLAEALAWRMDNKRIFSLQPGKARVVARVNDWVPLFWLDSVALEAELATRTFSGMSLAAETGFAPVSVVEYLRTHKYDESSL